LQELAGNFLEQTFSEVPATGRFLSLKPKSAFKCKSGCLADLHWDSWTQGGVALFSVPLDEVKALA
jgi:hypothetical protein